VRQRPVYTKKYYCDERQPAIEKWAKEMNGGPGTNWRLES